MQLRYELVDDLLSGLPLLQHKVLQSNVQQLEILLRVIIHEAEELFQELDCFFKCGILVNQNPVEGYQVIQRDISKRFLNI